MVHIMLVSDRFIAGSCKEADMRNAGAYSKSMIAYTGSSPIPAIIDSVPQEKVQMHWRMK